MTFRKAFVVNPPSPPNFVSNKDSMGGFGQLFPLGATLFPPLDLIYLASYLVEKKLCAVDLVECLALDLDKDGLVKRIAASTEPALIVVRTSAPTLDWDLGICDLIKREKPDCRIAIYGPVVPSVKHRIEREPSIDFIVAGDPEPVVEKLLSGAHASSDPLRLVPGGESGIAGLSFRRGETWLESPARPFTPDLDSLPFPKWELLPYERYRLPKSSAHSEVPFLPMLSSRGCPIGCHYCPYPVGQGLPWRHRSAQNVLDELEHLVRDLEIQYVIFRDPMFSLNQKRVADICEGIVARGLKVTWRCETRIDFLKPETLRAMARAGCEGINFGVESSDVNIQKGVGRRPIAQQQFLDCIALCRELGIKTFAFFIIGLPGDTVESILDTVRFAIRIRPTWMQFTAASPFIGTKLRTWAVARGLVTDDEYAYINSHQVAIGNDNLSKEQVQSLYRFARFIQAYLLNRRGILKEDHPSILYRAAKATADAASIRLAHIVFALGKMWFDRGAGPARPNLVGA